MSEKKQQKIVSKNLRTKKETPAGENAFDRSIVSSDNDENLERELENQDEIPMVDDDGDNE